MRVFDAAVKHDANRLSGKRQSRLVAINGRSFTSTATSVGPRLWQISENLHRADRTVLEPDEHIAVVEVCLEILRTFCPEMFSLLSVSP